MKSGVWDLFHDGSIASIDGGVPGDLLLKIEIKWLKQLFSKENDWIWLELRNCKLFEFKPEDQSHYLQNISTIQKQDLWIEDCEESGEGLTVYCHGGILRTRYGNHIVYLEEGQVISEETIRSKLDSDQSWKNY
ncbi:MULTISPECIES: hypothetical protein [unclassified Nitrospina]|uniref:hypothetical protein n=1 Tax=unclassified Nitrospina TaxID=2638683 RepID=UPI003F9D64DC